LLNIDVLQITGKSSYERMLELDNNKKVQRNLDKNNGNSCL